MGYLRNRGTKQQPEWYVRFRDVDGKWKQRHSHQPTKDEAHAFLADIEGRVKRGMQGIAEPTGEEVARRTITVGELAQRFLGEVDGVAGYAPPRIKSIANYRRDARTVFKSRVLPAWRDRAAASIGGRDVERLRDDLLGRGRAAASVVQTLAVVSKLFNWARKEGLVECANPVAGVERPRPSTSIDFLDAAEVGRLLATAEAIARPGAASWQSLALHPMAATAIYCGLRKGELFGLRWRDIHLGAGRLTIARSYHLLPKSGEPRHLPIHPELAAILERWKEVCPATSEGLVFPVEAEPGRFRMGVKLDTFALVEVLALATCHPPADGKPWHMLRHTFASHFVMRGGSLYTLQRLLGHSTAAMTMRYAHLAPDYLATEVARMSFAPAPPADRADVGEARRKRTANRARKEPPCS